MERIEVVRPVGAPSVEPKPPAARIDNLDGKTIGEVWNGVFKGDYTFPIIRELLKKKYPAARIVPYTEFPCFWGSYDIKHQKKMAVEIAAAAKEKGCDVLISGNGA